MKFLAYLCAPLVFVLVGVLFDGQEAPLIILGSICLVICLAVTLRNSTALLKIIFATLAMHAVFGLIVAEPSASATSLWIGIQQRQFYDTAFFVVSLGLMAAAFGFAFGRERGVNLPEVSEERFQKICRRVALLSTVGMFFVYYRLSALPWQIDIFSIGSTRYITGITAWVVNRFMDLLTITVPVLFLYGKREKLYGFAGFCALLLPFRRANIMAVLLLSALAWCIRRNRVKPLVATIALAVSVYASSQLFFVGMLGKALDTNTSLAVMGSALPEVRDLGWIMELNHQDYRWGSTFVQALLPLPSFVIPWAEEHSLRTVSTSLIGLDKESTGGLRLTLAGESYLNFGLLGVLPICFLWGQSMRWIDGAVRSVRADSRFQVYLVSLILSWLAFWIYLAGSQAGGVIKSGIIICVVLVYLSRDEKSARSPAPMSTARSSTRSPGNTV